MSGHVFISHSNDDREYASALADYLLSRDIPVFIAPTSVEAGDDWIDAIRDAVKQCAALVVVMTPAAEESIWVKRELRQAEKSRKPIFPLLLDGEEFFRINELQYLDVRGGKLPEEAFLAQLKSVILRDQLGQRSTGESLASAAAKWFSGPEAFGFTIREDDEHLFAHRYPAKPPKRVGTGVSLAVFYSFHYERDSWRVQQVVNMGAIEGQPILNSQSWEAIRRKGDQAIKNWIAEQMRYKEAVVVLVGAETAKREWVEYEIIKAWNDRRPLVGIRIHGLAGSNGRTDYAGDNPFKIALKSGRSIADYVPLHNPSGLNSSSVYSNIKTNIRGWVASAYKRD